MSEPKTRAERIAAHPGGVVVSVIESPHAVCSNCERCTWNPGPDCGKGAHPHCPTCKHCQYRHTKKAS